MPGKRTPADPGEMNVNVRDVNPVSDGIQTPHTAPAGAQFEHGEAPPENAYREQPNTKER